MPVHVAGEHGEQVGGGGSLMTEFLLEELEAKDPGEGSPEEPLQPLR